VLGIRPEAFEDTAFAPGLPTIDVAVEVLEDLGSDAHVFFTVAARSITAEVLEESLAEEAAGDAHGLIAGGDALFTARVDARTAATVGGTLRLAVDPGRLQFFDLLTGSRLLPQAVAAGTPAELSATS
jgi:ABC-type sugar transport system ATPase subunit